MSSPTDHERDMERLAARVAQLNQRDDALAASDTRNGTAGEGESR